MSFNVPITANVGSFQGSATAYFDIILDATPENAEISQGRINVNFDII